MTATSGQYHLKKLCFYGAVLSVVEPMSKAIDRAFSDTGYSDSLTYTLEPTCKVHRCKVFLDVRSIFGWSQ